MVNVESIDDLIGRLREISIKSNNIQSRYRDLLQDIEHLKSQIKEIRGEIEYRINEILRVKNRIKVMKEERRRVINELRRLRGEEKGIIDEIRRCNKLIREKPKLPQPIEILRGRLEELELKYETSSLGKRKEKKLVNEINRLSLLIKNYESYIQALSRKERLVVELDKCKEGLKKNYQRVKDLEEAIKKEVNKIDEIKSEALELQKKHRQLLNLYHEKKKELKRIVNQIKRVREEKREILRLIGLDSKLDLNTIIKILETHNQVIRKAMEKLLRKEKLTFEEFSILVRYGLISNLGS